MIRIGIYYASNRKNLWDINFLKQSMDILLYRLFDISLFNIWLTYFNTQLNVVHIIPLLYISSWFYSNIKQTLNSNNSYTFTLTIHLHYIAHHLSPPLHTHTYTCSIHQRTTQLQSPSIYYTHLHYNPQLSHYTSIYITAFFGFKWTLHLIVSIAVNSRYFNDTWANFKTELYVVLTDYKYSMITYV